MPEERQIPPGRYAGLVRTVRMATNAMRRLTIAFEGSKPSYTYSDDDAIELGIEAIAGIEDNVTTELDFAQTGSVEDLAWMHLEDCDCSILRTKDDQFLRVCEMETDHLENAAAWIERSFAQAPDPNRHYSRDQSTNMEYTTYMRQAMINELKRRGVDVEPAR